MYYFFLMSSFAELDKEHAAQKRRYIDSDAQRTAQLLAFHKIFGVDLLVIENPELPPVPQDRLSAYATYAAQIDPRKSI